MAKKLSEEDRIFRSVVRKHDGVQSEIAEELGLSVAGVQGRLRTEKHFFWWQRFKADRSKRRKKAQRKRGYEAAKARRRSRREAEAAAQGGFLDEKHRDRVKGGG